MCKIYGLEAVSGVELDPNFKKIHTNLMLSEFLSQIIPSKIFLRTYWSLIKESNPLNAELNPICTFASIIHHIIHISRYGVNKQKHVIFIFLKQLYSFTCLFISYDEVAKPVLVLYLMNLHRLRRM